MSLKKSILSVVMAILGFLCIGSFLQKDVKASSKYVVNYSENTTIKKKGISFTAKKVKNNVYHLIVKKNKKTKTITKKSNCNFLTDGKILYYVNRDKKLPDYQYKNTIYKYNVATGKRTKIISGTDYAVTGCNGSYLYYGKDEGPDGITLHALNLKTKKKKYMCADVGEVIVSDKYVATGTQAGDLYNYPIYTFKANGSKKKKVATGVRPLEIKNNKLYYYRVNINNWKVRIYKCSLNGKNKKAVTGWLNKLPDKYIN